MAEGNIDSLSISIGASTSRAIRSINNLAAAMNNLKTASSGMRLGQFKREIDTIQGTEINKIARLANALQGLKGVSINEKLPQNMLAIAVASEKIDERHINNLTAFGNALQSLKGAKTNIGDKLPDQLLNLAAAVDLITDEAIEKIKSLTSALGQLQGVDLRGLAPALKSGGGKKTKKATDGLGEAKDSGVGQVMKGAAQMADEMWDALGRTTPEAQKLLDIYERISTVLSETLSIFDGFDNAIAFFKSNLKTVLLTAVKIGASIAKWALNTALNVFKKIWNVMKGIAKSAVEAGKNMVKRWYDRSALKALEDGLKRIQKLISTFGRIALYRAVRSAIKYITDQLKQGTENAYWFAREFGSATSYIADAFDRLSSSNFKMSNQLGAAWATLIAKIEPVLMRIIDMITRAADAITQFFAILSGKDTYLKAVDYNKAWADSADDAAQSAKEWRNQLMGFDEINRLDEPSDGSKGKKKNEYDDYQNMFVETPLPTSQFFKDIQDAFENGKWAELGQILGNKFNEIINSVDWAGLGKYIGEKLQAAIDIGYNFLKTADFKNLGAKLAEFLNNTSDQIDFYTLGRLVTRIKTSLWDVLYGAIVGINWRDFAINLSDYIIGSLNETADWLRGLNPQEIAQAIKDFFSGIKYGDIRDAFVEVVSLAWEKAIELKDAIFDEETKAKISDAMDKFFATIKWEDIKETIKTKLKSAWKWVTERFDEIWPKEDREALKEKLKSTLAEILHDAIHEALFGRNPETVAEAISPLSREAREKGWSFGKESGEDSGEGFKEGFEESMNTVRDETVPTVFNEVIDAAKTVLDSHSPSVRFMEIGSDTMEGFKQGLEEKWPEVSDWITTSWEEFTTKFAEGWDTVKTDTETAWEDIITKFTEGWETIKTDTETACEEITTALQETWDGISENSDKFLDEMKDETSKALEDTLKTTNETLDLIRQDMQATTDAVTINVYDMEYALYELGATFSETCESVGSSTMKMANDVVNSIHQSENVINVWFEKMFMQLDRLIEKLKKAYKYKKSVFGSSGYGDSDGDYSYGGYSSFATGGFPEDGLFFANHGEMVGKFTNGKTAVANNEQIVAGISQGVYNAMVAAGSGNKGGGTVVLNVNGREFMRAIYGDMQAVTREHGISLVTNG